MLRTLSTHNEVHRELEGRQGHELWAVLGRTVWHGKTQTKVRSHIATLTSGFGPSPFTLKLPMMKKLL